MDHETSLVQTLRHRRCLLYGADVVAWAVGLALAQVDRYDLHLRHVISAGFLVSILAAALVQGLLGHAFHLYRGRFRIGSFDEVSVLATVMSLTVALLLVIDLPTAPRLVPASVPLLGGIAALVGMSAVRYLARSWLHRSRRPSKQTAAPLLIFGAGEAGAAVIHALLRDRNSPFFPVGVLDDSPRKQNLRIWGVRVLGGRDALAREAARLEVKTLLIALPSADAELMREITASADAAGVTVKVLPPVADLIGGGVTVADIRDLDLTDLLGRRQVEVDLDEIAGYVTGRRVLVTGAGGSIGSELCRQLHQFAPAELIMLDRDESALHAVQLSIHGRALLDGSDTVLADIRDIQHITQIFEQRRPQVVFHAAALKHLPMLEQFPGESVKTNVWGTLTVLQVAAGVGVERFVNISTDKAANPISVLGYSKRITERLTAAVGLEASGSFVSVRFGNVLGSRGSVLSSFRQQVAIGGPITVTHPDVTRYFMTIREAVQLVIQAGALGEGGGVLVLDMGKPVRIADVARRLAADAPRPIQVTFTGLRRGEKLHEDLFGDQDGSRWPVHPMIAAVSATATQPVDVLEIDAWGNADELRESLALLAHGGDLMPESSRRDGTGEGLKPAEESRG